MEDLNQINQNGGSEQDEVLLEKRCTMLLCLLAFVVSLLNFGIQFFVTGRLPESVPVHAGFNMMVDRWGSPLEIRLLCLLPVALSVVMLVVQRFAGGTGTNRRITNMVIVLTMLLFLGASWMGVCMAFQYERAAMGQPLPVWILLLVLIPLSLVMIVTGNYSARIKPNRWLGIRTRSTFSDETVWRKTHRVGGFFFVAGGLALAILSVVAALVERPVMVLVGLGVVIACVFVPVFYARMLLRRQPSKDSDMK